MTEEKSEKMLEAEARTLSILENTYRGLCSDIAKWRKRGVKKYKKEILAAVAELDAFEGEKWVRLGVAQKALEREKRFWHGIKEFKDQLLNERDDLRGRLEQAQKDLRERAIRLLQHRAGGRYTMFEAGMLYQICLSLGMKDSREGGIGEQEKQWEKLTNSCFTSEEAKEKLEKVLGDSGSAGGSASEGESKSELESSANSAPDYVSGYHPSRVAVGTPSGKPAPQPKTQAEDCCFRKVKVLRGRAKEAADKQGLGPEDLVVLTTKIKKGEPPEYMVEKVEGDAVSFLLKRAVVGGEATSRD